MVHRLVCLWFLIFVATLTATAGGEDQAFSFSPPIKGQRVAAYFTAFNFFQPKAMETFFGENLSAASVAGEITAGLKRLK